MSTISPQGYVYGAEPQAENPFWEGGGGNVNLAFSSVQLSDQEAINIANSDLQITMTVTSEGTTTAEHTEDLTLPFTSVIEGTAVYLPFMIDGQECYLCIVGTGVDTVKLDSVLYRSNITITGATIDSTLLVEVGGNSGVQEIHVSGSATAGSGELAMITTCTDTDGDVSIGLSLQNVNDYSYDTVVNDNLKVAFTPNVAPADTSLISGTYVVGLVRKKNGVIVDHLPNQEFTLSLQAVTLDGNYNFTIPFTADHVQDEEENIDYWDYYAVLNSSTEDPNFGPVFDLLNNSSTIERLSYSILKGEEVISNGTIFTATQSNAVRNSNSKMTIDQAEAFMGSASAVGAPGSMHGVITPDISALSFDLSAYCSYIDVKTGESFVPTAKSFSSLTVKVLNDETGMGLIRGSVRFNNTGNYFRLSIPVYLESYYIAGGGVLTIVPAGIGIALNDSGDHVCYSVALRNTITGTIASMRPFVS